jgi:hypothetical protein
MGVARKPWYFLLPSYWLPKRVDSKYALAKVRSSCGCWGGGGGCGGGCGGGGAAASWAAAPLHPPPCSRAGEWAASPNRPLQRPRRPAARPGLDPPRQVADQDTRGIKQPPAEGAALDEDVAEEEKRMRAMLAHRTGLQGELAGAVDTRNAVEVYGLRKMFGCAAACAWANSAWACAAGAWGGPARRAPGVVTPPLLRRRLHSGARWSARATPSGPSRAAGSTSPRTSCSACWAPTAPARPPPSSASPASCPTQVRAPRAQRPARRRRGTTARPGLGRRRTCPCICRTSAALARCACPAHTPPLTLHLPSPCPPCPPRRRRAHLRPVHQLCGRRGRRPLAHGRVPAV